MLLLSILLPAFADKPPLKQGKPARKLLPEAPAPAVIAQTGVRIVDRGKVCSTYRLNEITEERLLAASGMTPEQLAVLMPLSQEEHWPEGWQTLGGRGENEQWFEDLVVYPLAAFDGGCGGAPETLLLHAPAAENQHLPPIVRPRTDFYVFITSEGVSR